MSRIIRIFTAAIALFLAITLPASAAAVDLPSVVISDPNSSSNVTVYDTNKSVVIKRGGSVSADYTWLGFCISRGTTADVYPTDDHGRITGPKSQTETTSGCHAFKAGSAEFVDIKTRSTVQPTKPSVKPASKGVVAKGKVSPTLPRR